MLKSSRRLFDYTNFFSYFFLLANIIAVPLFLDPSVVNPFVISKEYLFIGLVLVNILLWAVKIILSKKLVYTQSVFDKPVLVLLAIALVSAFFSTTRTDSFLGRNDYFVFHFVLLLFLAVFSWLLVQHLNTPERWRRAADTLVVSGGITASLFFIKAFFNFDIFARWFPGIWNTIDVTNGAFGIWLVAIFLLAAGQMIKKDLTSGRLLLYFFVALITFLSLVVLSFFVIWWALIIGLVLLLLSGVSSLKEARLGWLSTLFAAFILAVIFIVFGTPKVLQPAIPVEVNLNFRSSWHIVSATFLSGAKNLVLGSGLGTFAVDFSQFRDVNFNNDQYAWSLRFYRPVNSVFALLAEGGILFTLVWLFLIVLVAERALVTWLRWRRADKESEEDFELLRLLKRGLGGQNPSYLSVFLLAVPWLVVGIAAIFVFYGPVLWWLWFLLLGLTVAGLTLYNPATVQVKELVIEDTPEHNLSFSFALIVAVAAVCIIGVWGTRLYLAEIRYAEALQTGSFELTEEKLAAAINYRGNVDIYHAARAQNYLLEAIRLSRLPAPDLDRISVLVGQAINAARQATNLSPRSVAIWENLATMYENAAALVPEARGWAMKSWEEAMKLEPTNPVLAWRLGNNYAAAGNWSEAIAQYRKAIELKRDHLGAYLGLANAYEQTSETDKAIALYVSIAPIAQNDVDYLFNFGRLLYNRNQTGDRGHAETLWLEVVQRQPNFSNALYSLGLLYEGRGNKTKALEYYYRVKNLNPNNKDINAKITRLINGG